jgi:hypothetical protein
MRNDKIWWMLVVLLLSLGACSQKSGCPAEESLKPKLNKQGELSKRHNKRQEGLFPKHMRKKMG